MVAGAEFVPATERATSVGGIAGLGMCSSGSCASVLGRAAATGTAVLVVAVDIDGAGTGVGGGPNKCGLAPTAAAAVSVGRLGNMLPNLSTRGARRDVVEAWVLAVVVVLLIVVAVVLTAPGRGRIAVCRSGGSSTYSGERKQRSYIKTTHKYNTYYSRYILVMKQSES